ncbi:glycosyltransferase family 4 protein [Bacteroides sp. 519]|uniref:glycosyltransferase family 4 protein n=1 Tax=Bacteroides sp. 519 TaxID=2302937 RepID=UPI001EF17913|nr:glycosyltransferase family 4 protein [Bacteroides sp. 519]
MQLSQLGHKQQVIVPCFKQTENIICGDVRFEYFIRESNWMKRFFFMRKIKKITHFVEENIELEKIDIIHAHTLFSDGAVAYILNGKYKIPYITAVRNTDINIFFKYLIQYRKLGVEILKCAKKIIFLSPYYKTKTIKCILSGKLSGQISAKSYVIPNGVNAFWLYDRMVKKRKEDKAFSLLFIGSFDNNKNIIKVCKAIESLNKIGLNIKFTVVGRGWKGSESYTKRIEQIEGISSYLTIIDHQGKEELKNIFADNDIFIMMSKKETFGLVYVEALTQGLPIIYSKGQGIDGYFKEGSVGYHANPNSVDDIALKIRQVVENYNDIIENIASSDFSSFNWRNVALEYDKIYTQIKNEQR